MSDGSNILIVEDEILISDSIARHLRRWGHRIAGQAISFEEAAEFTQHSSLDLVLLDIRLFGERDGIEFAEYLRRQSAPPPFIYLTSQVDQASLARAKRTQPAGYLAKPIQLPSLRATIDTVLYNHRMSGQEAQGPTIQLKRGKKTVSVPTKDILYLQADHVYVKVVLITGETFLHRGTLSALRDLFTEDSFLQTHRSYIVSIDHITAWSREFVEVGGHRVPVSRQRRQAVITRMERAMGDEGQEV